MLNYNCTVGYLIPSKVAHTFFVVFFYFTLTTQKEKVSFSVRNKSGSVLAVFRYLVILVSGTKVKRLILFGLLNDIVRDLDCEESHYPIRIISLFLLQNCRSVKL
jgi:hypothetical protein